MKRKQRWGLSIGAKLMILSLGFLAIPALGYWASVEMKSFLLAGQENAQILTAQAIAAPLHNRDDLFEAGGSSDPEKNDRSFHVHILDGQIELDGYSGDWGALSGAAIRFDEGRNIVGGAPLHGSLSASFDLTLGQYDDYLYALVQVDDDKFIRNGDHIRLIIFNGAGNSSYYQIKLSDGGSVAAIQMGADWREPVSKISTNIIQGHWRKSGSGYTAELRLPIKLPGNDRINIAVADTDDDGGAVSSIIGTFDDGAAEMFSLVTTRSAELERIIKGLDMSGPRVMVIDRLGRLRAMGGGSGSQNSASAPNINEESVIKSALNGKEAASRPTSYSQSPDKVIIAAAPVFLKDNVMGAVVVEQSIDKIQALQQKTMSRVFTLALLAFLVVGLSLFIFSSRLSFRIHRLQDEAERAIDSEGRVRFESLDSDSRSADEIGDLSRTVSDLLGKLGRYMNFLEKLPKTLNHEISNPLNSISTSLQQLKSERPELNDSIYAQSLERGVDRLGEIMRGLTEAANLEEALKAEELTKFDLAELVETYVNNRSGRLDARSLLYSAANGSYPFLGSDFHIEQLLDKLVDNAIDFSKPGSEILISLKQDNGQATLSVVNMGAPINQEESDDLFDSMISIRTPTQNDKPHMGIGLYVARVIAESHGGSINALNRQDPAGVEIRVLLPLDNEDA